MPSADLLVQCRGALDVEGRWWVPGTHYALTLNAWLARMDGDAAAVARILRERYGKDEAALWFQRWRMFFMACAELFDFDRGREWGVAHYLFVRP
jgi:cyclopropane-fatty-acyl-phospholipid synthase